MCSLRLLVVVGLLSALIPAVSADCAGGEAFGQTIVAPDKNTFTWPNVADVAASRPVSGQDRYASLLNRSPDSSMRAHGTEHRELPPSTHPSRKCLRRGTFSIPQVSGSRRPDRAHYAVAYSLQKSTATCRPPVNS